MKSKSQKSRQPANARRRRPLLRSLLLAAAWLGVSTAAPAAKGETTVNPFVPAAITATGPEADYVEGLRLAYLQSNDAAEAALRRFIASRPADKRQLHEAWSLLGGMALRAGAYAQALEAFEHSLAECEGTLDADLVKGAQQNIGVAKALRHSPAQRTVALGESSLAIVRDKMGLARVEVSLQSAPVSVVWDTGANLCTASESFARQQGLTFLEGQIEVSTSTGQPTAGRLALAEDLHVGACHLQHVVFVILPDQALNFPQVNYRIDAILGFPVIEALGRIRFPSPERVEVGLPSVRPPAPQLALNGLDVYVLAEYKDQPVPFFLDSGAHDSSLSSDGAARFPEWLEGATLSRHQRGGAGGVVTVEEPLVKEVELRLGGRRVVLENVMVQASEANQVLPRYGVIGSKTLFSGHGYEIELRTGHFALLP